MKSTVAGVLALGASLAVTACGSSTKTSSTATPQPGPAQSAAGGGGATVALAADPGGQLKFDKQQASATAGSVTITFKNPSPIDHGVSIEGNGVSIAGRVIAKGASSSQKVSLKPGSYTFFCPVPGHRQAGMQGTLTVH